MRRYQLIQTQPNTMFLFIYPSEYVMISYLKTSQTLFKNEYSLALLNKPKHAHKIHGKKYIKTYYNQFHNKIAWPVFFILIAILKYIT